MRNFLTENGQIFGKQVIRNAPFVIAHNQNKWKLEKKSLVHDRKREHFVGYDSLGRHAMMCSEAQVARRKCKLIFKHSS